MNKRGFASDNNAGVHPDILKAIQEANSGHVVAYGDDPYTRKATAMMQDIFGSSAAVYFVFTGTAANVLSLNALTRSYNAVICPETAHINVDECGAPEKFTGCKLLTVPASNGKLTVADVRTHLHGIGFEHHVQPIVISVTQATELGTVYTLDEIRELTRFAHDNNMFVHLDGARLSNAAVSLGASFKELTSLSGVDAVSFGGTKNGMMYGEAVLIFNSAMAEGFKYLRKQAMQLASKMRFIAAQFIAYLENDLWKENAAHANKMARLLEANVRSIPGISITQRVEANGVFAIIPPEIIPQLQKEYFFYMWDDERSEVRWMTSFDTTEDDVIRFTALLKKLMAGKAN